MINVIEYDEAVSIAKGIDGGFSHCGEYTGAYVFSGDEGGDGGMGTLAVTKDDGATLDFVFALTSGRLGDFVREFDI